MQQEAELIAGNQWLNHLKVTVVNQHEHAQQQTRIPAGNICTIENIEAIKELTTELQSHDHKCDHMD